MEAFWTGVIAGYGIAIPVGAIAVLIVEVGIRCGFRCGFFAGAGAATADLIYATLAVIGGVGLAAAVDSINEPFRYVSAAALAVIAVLGLRRAGTQPEIAETAIPSRGELAATYARFVGLTIINPTTVIYFAAFIVGLGVAQDLTVIEGIWFAVGAFLASLSWQTLLAGLGHHAGRRLPAAVQKGAMILGNLVVLGFAVLIVIR